jgi:hypothetical protein
LVPDKSVTKAEERRRIIRRQRFAEHIEHEIRRLNRLDLMFHPGSNFWPTISGGYGRLSKPSTHLMAQKPICHRMNLCPAGRPLTHTAKEKLAALGPESLDYLYLILEQCRLKKQEI